MYTGIEAAGSKTATKCVSLSQVIHDVCVVIYQNHNVVSSKYGIRIEVNLITMCDDTIWAGGRIYAAKPHQGLIHDQRMLRAITN